MPFLLADIQPPRRQQTRFGLTAITGPGLLAVEGDVHKRQVRHLKSRLIAFLTPLWHSGGYWCVRRATETPAGILTVHPPQNPAFSASQIREFTPIFHQKVHSLADAWKREIVLGGKDIVELDVLNWFGRVTLDVIGEVGMFTSHNNQEKHC